MTSSLMSLLHQVSPYQGFDADAHPPDLQGWGSSDPIFREIIAALRPRIIVEIGTWKGASAIHMAGIAAELGLDTQILCVDTWLGSPEHFLGKRPAWRESLRMSHGYPSLYFTFLANVVRAGLADRIVPLPNTSENAAVILRELGIRPDLVYIDAAHEEQAVHRDLASYWEMVSPDGAILGDDYLEWNGVTRAADRFAASVGRRILGRPGKYLIWRREGRCPRIRSLQGRRWPW